MRRGALLVLVLALQAGTASASCDSQLRPNTRVEEQTRDAVVYSRIEREERMYFGCEWRTGKLWRLNHFDPIVHLDRIALAGRYVAFSAWVEEPAGSETIESVNFRNLRNGRHRRLRAVSRDAAANTGDEFVTSLVAKPNGSIAWIAQREDPELLYQVNALEAGRDNRRTKLDEGSAIGPHSLGLSSNGARVYWTRGGDPRSAPLR